MYNTLFVFSAEELFWPLGLGMPHSNWNRNGCGWSS